MVDTIASDTIASDTDTSIQPNTHNAITDSEVAKQLDALEGWDLRGNAIEKTFRFENFTDTMRFVNQVAEIADVQDHHPEMLVGYDYCKLTYITHDWNGLSDRDFIAAAAVNAFAISNNNS